MFKKLAFRLKLWATRKQSSLSEIFVSSDVLAKTTDDYASDLINLEDHEEKIDDFRRKNSREISNLRALLYRQDINNRKEIETKINQDINEYINYLNQELKDVEKILDLSQRIAENEYISVIYDIRRPLQTFTHYRNTLTNQFKNIGLPTELKNSIVKILVEIGLQYDLIIKHTMDLANAIRLQGLPDSSKGLIQAMSARTSAKKRLSGKTTSIINAINNLEKFFQQFKQYKILGEKEADLVLKNITEFKNIFSQLMTFSKTRIDASGTILAEVKKLQQKKLEELEELKKNIREMLREGNNLVSTYEKQLAINNTNLKKQINEDPKQYKQKIANEVKIIKQNNKQITKILKEFDKKITNLQKKDKNIIRTEEQQQQIEIRQLQREAQNLEREQQEAIKKINESDKVLEKFRKTKLTWIVAGLMSFQTIAPAISAIYQHMKQDKRQLVVYGTPNQIAQGLAQEGIELGTEIYQQVLVEFSDTLRFSNKFNRDFSPDFQPTSFSQKSEELLVESIIKKEQEIIIKAKKITYPKLKDTNLSKEEKDALIEQAIVVFIVIKDGVIKTYVCPINSTLSEQRNLDLGEAQAHKLITEILTRAFSKENSELFSGFDVQTLKDLKIEVVEVRRHHTIKKVTDELNHFYKHLSPEQKEAFFKDYPAYQRFKEMLEESEINYQKFAERDTKEYIKFNIIARMYKHYKSQEYEKKIVAVMDELRRVEFEAVLITKVTIHGGEIEETPTLYLFPLANNDNKDVVKSYDNSQQKYVPRKIGDPFKGYKSMFKKNRPRMKFGGNQGNIGGY